MTFSAERSSESFTASVNVEFVSANPTGPLHAGAGRWIATGDAIIKYGQVIGRASRDIDVGEHVHTHNVAMLERDTTLTDFQPFPRSPTQDSDRTFMGYHRPNGQVGTRNYIGILSTVNCSATVAKVAAEQLNANPEIEALGFDGVVPITHGSGCAMNTESEGFAFLERVIAGYARHPNFALVVIIGLSKGKNWARILIHELSHSQLNTDDVTVPGDVDPRYSWHPQGIAPRKDSFHTEYAMNNADSWAFFAVDAAGMLTTSERNVALNPKP